MESSLPLTLPEINPDLIAANISERSPEVMAAVYILEGQYLVRYREQQQTVTKFVSPSAIRTAFSHIPIDSGFLPPDVVRWGSNSQGNWLVKFISPDRKSIILVDNSQPISVTIPLPGLVFLGLGYHYYLWAVKTPKFDPQASVFNAPFPNLNASGDICFGQNRVPQCSASNIEAAWNLFLTSPFNGDAAAGKSKAHPDDVRQQLKAVAGKKRYPLRDLVPISPHSSMTVTQIIERILESSG